MGKPSWRARRKMNSSKDKKMGDFLKFKKKSNFLFETFCKKPTEKMRGKGEPFETTGSKKSFYIKKIKLKSRKFFQKPKNRTGIKMSSERQNNYKVKWASKQDLLQGRSVYTLDPKSPNIYLNLKNNRLNVSTKMREIAKGQSLSKSMALRNNSLKKLWENSEDGKRKRKKKASIKSNIFESMEGQAEHEQKVLEEEGPARMQLNKSFLSSQKSQNQSSNLFGSKEFKFRTSRMIQSTQNRLNPKQIINQKFNFRLNQMLNN